MQQRFWGLATIAAAIGIAWLWRTGRLAATWQSIVYGSQQAPSNGTATTTGPQPNNSWIMPLSPTAPASSMFNVKDWTAPVSPILEGVFGGATNPLTTSRTPGNFFNGFSNN